MQIREPPEDMIHPRPGIAKVRGGVRIEQTCHATVAAFQYHDVGLAGPVRLCYAENFVSRIGPPGTLFDLFQPNPWSARVGNRNRPAPLPAVDDGGAREADYQDVEANTDAHPQVDLEEDPSNEQTLRASHPLLPERHFPLSTGYRLKLYYGAMRALILSFALFVPLLGADMTTLTISVKSTTGKPVEGASVIVKFVKGHSVTKLGKKIRKEWELRTNQEGLAKIPPIPQGTILVQVIAKDYQTFGKDFDVDEEQQTLDIRLNPPQPQYSAH
jgi:hypothetical protein